MNHAGGISNELNWNQCNSMTDVFHSDWSHAGIKKEYNWMNEFSSPITTFVDHYYISTIINYYIITFEHLQRLHLLIISTLVRLTPCAWVWVSHLKSWQSLCTNYQSRNSHTKWLQMVNKMPKKNLREQLKRVLILSVHCPLPARQSQWGKNILTL